MKITPEMIERAARVLRRIQNPRAIDSRPWRQVISKTYFREQVRKVLTAALKH